MTGVLLFQSVGAHAQDSNAALLDALVKKKILSPQEAQKIKADTEVQDAKVQAEITSNKVRLSDPVKQMDIYGELRLRYFFNEAEEDTTGDHGVRNRYRYRLRIGDNITLSDNLMIGVLVEANNSAHSANVTLGAGDSTLPDAEVFNKGTVATSSGVAGITTGRAVVGFDAKTGKPVYGTVVTGETASSFVSSVNFQDALFFSQVYLRYKPFSWLTLEGGKIPNPLISTRMVWDPDINPEGLAEQFHITLGPWDAKSSGDNKDGPAPVQDGLSVDLFANLAQFIYEDVWTNYFDSPSGAQTPQKNDLWMLAWQFGAKVNLNKDTFLQVAPTIYNYTGGGSEFAATFNGDGPAVILNSKAQPEFVTFNQVGTNNLLILDVPAEFDWKMWKVPFKIFGDYAHNFEGADRATRAGHPDKTNEDTSYQIGLESAKSSTAAISSC